MVTQEQVPLQEDGSLDVMDCHMHLAWQDCVPGEFIASSAANVLANLRARGGSASLNTVVGRVLAQMQDSKGDALVAEMDRARIRRGCLLVPDMTFALKRSRFTIEELLLHHRDVARRHEGRFIAFAGTDPRWGKSGLDLFERALRDWGYGGMKLYPPCGFSPADPIVYPFYELCRAYRVPVLVHIGPTAPALSFATSHPLMLDQPCRDFPTVNFVLGHGGSHYVEECSLLAAFRPNVYIDVSGFQRVGGVERGMGRLSELFDRGINHKLLFGTDFPVFQDRLSDLTRGLWAESGPLSDLSSRDAALIARDNFLRLWSEPASWADADGTDARAPPAGSGMT